MTGSIASIANLLSLRICHSACPCHQPAARSLGKTINAPLRLSVRYYDITMSNLVRITVRSTYNSLGIRSGPVSLVDFSAFSFASLAP
ncbi:hypothetical protein CORC01_04136 [Colletotrichum orchidophilum]|uniref:Secreted protein n=1 Tax=Colletotrichum orchidophilum TaxID=1209926 RepID=A0A1G4BH34_9PEZI|nr:uncharacterized protein CORC01_04136 [Colletotrichum orchidophilum]OHF00597.1 hypothetical protein CORC01_04136 [Colletotrichum orchidophilum]